MTTYKNGCVVIPPDAHIFQRKHWSELFMLGFAHGAADAAAAYKNEHYLSGHVLGTEARLRVSGLASENYGLVV